MDHPTIELPTPPPHDWRRHGFRPPSGKVYFGKRCATCGIKVVARGRLTRWIYPDGRIAETATIDAPSCHPAHPTTAAPDVRQKG